MTGHSWSNKPTFTSSVQVLRPLHQSRLSSNGDFSEMVVSHAIACTHRKRELSQATPQGFDIELVRAVSDAVSIPVIASSGAGCAAHFTEVFQQTKAAAALAAGIFHRKEVQILDVKREMDRQGIAARLA